MQHRGEKMLIFARGDIEPSANFSEGEIYLQMTNTGVADVLPG